MFQKLEVDDISIAKRHFLLLLLYEVLALWIVNYVVNYRINIYTVFLGIGRLNLEKFEQIRIAILALQIVSLLLQVLVLLLQLEFWLVSSLFGLRE